MNERDTLLSWTHEMYGWLGSFSEPAAHGRSHEDHVENALQWVHASRTTLAGMWPSLVPLDREQVVDALLGQVCQAFCSGEFDARQVSADAVKHMVSLSSVGWPREAPLPSSFYDYIESLVKLASNEYVNRFSSPSPPDEASFPQSWRRSLLVGPAALNVVKLVHVGYHATNLIRKRLLYVDRRMRDPEEDRVTLESLMWPVDKLLLLAHIHAQPAQRRYEVLCRLLVMLDQLYSPENKLNAAEHDTKLE